MKLIRSLGPWIGLLALFSCSKTKDPVPKIPVSYPGFNYKSIRVNGTLNGFSPINVNHPTSIQIDFTSPINSSTVQNSIRIANNRGVSINYTFQLNNSDSTLILLPAKLSSLTKYSFNIDTSLHSSNKGSLSTAIQIPLYTGIDSTDKFPILTDDQLLELVQKQTFTYFWDFGHPVSGFARERNTSGDLVTTGGTGFGVLAILVGVNHNFISRSDGLTRLQKIVGFIKNNAQSFHGALPHWLNGSTGLVIPFSSLDDGADLVETSYLMQGLLTARQFFNGTSTDEINLRSDINSLWNRVEWDWFLQNGQNVLYWHWSPDQNWAINMPIKGWNEALIVYALAASSTTHPIPISAYDNGWAGNGGMKNGLSYYGTKLPLGPAFGGPLFFAHYSFLGINPNGLMDKYASYDVQNQAQAGINYAYCSDNPKKYYGYSGDCWGLTASDIENGYAASSPSLNDLGVIAPTGAISSLPYTPIQSLKALRFFYYKLGDRTWGPYGFYDSFNLSTGWFANSNLAIDEGPIIIMIENYRNSFLWNLFMSCPEIKTGMKNLGFQSPNL